MTRQKESLERTPPHSVEAERCLLGCVLLDPAEGVSRCREFFPSGAPFLYDTRHQVIFDAIEGMLAAGNDVDVSKLMIGLEASGKLEQIGGFAYLSALMDSVASVASIGFYISTVREKWVARQFIAAGTRIVQRAYEADNVQELADQTEAEILTICRGDREQQTQTFDAEKVVAAALLRAEQRHKDTAGQTKRMLTGFWPLDSIVRLRPGNLIILAARPGMGKTSLALSIAVNMLRQGTPVGFLTLEMTAEELSERMACMIGEVESQKLDGEMEDSDFQRYDDALAAIKSFPIWIEYGCGMNIWTARHRIRQLKQRHNIGIAFVDFLTLLRGEKRDDNREQEVASITLGLKGLAGELGIPIICLAQLNREIEKGGWRAPRNSDLRESGAIEQAADQIWFPHQTKELPDSQEAPDVDLIVSKQRNGRAGGDAIAPLVFVKRFTKFQERMPVLPTYSE